MPDLAWFHALWCVPLLGALVTRVAPRRAADGLAIGTSGLALLIASSIVWQGGIAGVTISLGGLPIVDRPFGHPVQLFGFRLDALASFVLLGNALIGLACVLYATAYVGPRNRELPMTDDRRPFYFWFLVFVGAMAGLATSATLVQLFLFWEITTICSWALIGFYQEEHGALAAAYKAFLMTAGGGLALFAALIVLLALTGSASFDAFALLPAGARSTLALSLLCLMCVGAWAKSGQVPFHTWLPDAMVAPTPVSAYLHAASMVNAGAYLVLRLVTSAPRDSAGVALPSALGAMLAIMGVATLVVAVMQFFYQQDLKRLLALSTIAGLAYVFIGAGLGAAGSERAVQGAALHILAHGAGKGLLFLSVGTLSYTMATRRIGDLAGVLHAAPVAAMGFLIGMLTVTGVPPFAGFWSKFALIGGAVQLGGWGLFIGVVLLAESVIAFAWLLWVGQKVFLGKPSLAVIAASPPSRAMDTGLVFLMLLCLLLPLIGLPLADAVRLGGGK
jgi:hydrogenase-4 component D